MTLFTTRLWELAEALLSPAQVDILKTIATASPLNYAELSLFDASLTGPSLDRVSCSGYGRYHLNDRDVFRPLQYCSRYFARSGDLEWFSRHIVHTSSLHIEVLAKRIACIGNLPLGALLGKPLIRARLDTITRDQMKLMSTIYNASKHKVDQPKDTHLFSVEDAVVAYITCRRLAQKLYAHSNLHTDLLIFDQDCD